MKKKFIFYLVIGILIRILLMPFMGHPDILGNAFYADKAITEKFFKIYDYSLTISDIPYTHPPGNLYVLCPYIFIIKKLIPDFNNIISINFFHTMDNPYIFRTLFLLKLPFLLLDILICIIIFYFIENKQEIKKTLFWIFNPVVIYCVYCYGQDDIFMIFFLLLSLIFFDKQKYIHSAIFLAISAIFKQSTIFLYIPFLIFSWKNKKDFFIYFLILVFVPLFLSFPFLFSAGFKKLVIFPEQSQGILKSVIYLSFRDRIYPFILFYFFIIFLFCFNISRLDYKTYFSCSTSLFLLFYSIIHFHPQWFFWLIPFFLFLPNKNFIKHSYWILVILFFIYILYWGRNTTTALLAPLGSFVSGLPSPSKIFSLFMHEYKVIGIFRSIFSGLCVFLIYNLYSDTAIINKNEVK